MIILVLIAVLLSGGALWAFTHNALWGRNKDEFSDELGLHLQSNDAKLNTSEVDPSPNSKGDTMDQNMKVALDLLRQDRESGEIEEDSSWDMLSDTEKASYLRRAESQAIHGPANE